MQAILEGTRTVLYADTEATSIGQRSENLITSRG